MQVTLLVVLLFLLGAIGSATETWSMNLAQEESGELENTEAVPVVKRFPNLSKYHAKGRKIQVEKLNKSAAAALDKSGRFEDFKKRKSDIDPTDAHNRELLAKRRLLNRLMGSKSPVVTPDALRIYLSNAKVDISPEILPQELRTPLTLLPPLAKCGTPSNVRILKENFNSQKDFQLPAIKAFLGDPVNYANNEVNPKHESFSDIDSRHQTPVLGTPGGDFGEFLVGLSVMEDMIKYQFNEGDVKQLLTQWLVWKRRKDVTFFHSTDDEAVRKLATQLHIDGVNNVLTDINIFNPPVDLRAEMLLVLNQTRFQGSRVVRQFLQFPQRYQIRGELTSHLIRSFYQLLWDKETLMADDTPLFTKLHLEVYNEKPHPLAWLSVRSSSNCEVSGAAHTIKPTTPIPTVLLNTKNFTEADIPSDWAASLPQPKQKNAVALELGIDETIYKELGIPMTHPSNDPAVNAAASMVEMEKIVAAAKKASSKAKSAVKKVTKNSKTTAKTAAKTASKAKAAVKKVTNSSKAKAAVNKATKGSKTNKASKPTSKKTKKTPMEPLQMFIHHPHAVHRLRVWISRFFALRFPLAASQVQILKVIERKQKSVLEGIAESVGRNVPFYSITIE